VKPYPNVDEHAAEQRQRAQERRSAREAVIAQTEDTKAADKDDSAQEGEE